jgi:glutamate synthase domain-containing protein 2
VQNQKVKSKIKYFFSWKNPWFITPLLMGSAYLVTFQLPRAILGYNAKKTLNRILTDPYSENIWELISASTRATPQVIVENSLRTEEGRIIKRPLGSPRRMINFDGLVFNIAQLATEPTTELVKVDTSVVIGPKARKPLYLSTPMIVSAMAYGLALSEKAKLALAYGSALAGTAIVSGENGYFPLERNAADKYIVQYHRGNWYQGTAWCNKSDMIEIQLGQGASAGITHSSHYKDLPIKARQLMGLEKGTDAVIKARLGGIKSRADFKNLIDRLRDKSGGVPIGVKIGAGNQLEEDMAIALEAGVDVIAIDGSEAATVGSEPLLQDAFGLPTLIALCRGAKFLKEQGLKGEVSLIISGGLYHPEHFLKAIALGADAVYLGTVCLFAVAHHAIASALPWEPPTSLVMSTGKYSEKINIQKGAKDLAKFFKSCTLEMVSGVRALGKSSLSQVDVSDLAALDQQTADITGVPLAYRKKTAILS